MHLSATLVAGRFDSGCIYFKIFAKKESLGSEGEA